MHAVLLCNHVCCDYTSLVLQSFFIESLVYAVFLPPLEPLSFPSLLSPRVRFTLVLFRVTTINVTSGKRRVIFNERASQSACCMGFSMVCVALLLFFLLTWPFVSWSMVMVMLRLLFRLMFGFGKLKFLETTRKDQTYIGAFLVNQPIPTIFGW